MFFQGLLRVPWTARRSNQSILKEISPEYSLEGLMLKLKLQYFGHVMWRADSLEKTLMLGGIEGKRRRGRQRMRWLDSMDMSLSKFQEIVEEREAWHAAVCGVCKELDMTEWLKKNNMHYHVWNRELVGSCCIAQGAQLAALWWPRGLGWGGGTATQEEGDICIHMAGSCCCTAEINTTLQSKYTPVRKINLTKKESLWS